MIYSLHQSLVCNLCAQHPLRGAVIKILYHLSRASCVKMHRRADTQTHILTYVHIFIVVYAHIVERERRSWQKDAFSKVNIFAVRCAAVQWTRLKVA